MLGRITNFMAPSLRTKTLSELLEPCHTDINAVQAQCEKISHLFYCYGPHLRIFYIFQYQDKANQHSLTM